jgi:hypothetical protein
LLGVLLGEFHQGESLVSRSLMEVLLPLLFQFVRISLNSLSLQDCRSEAVSELFGLFA